MSKTYSQKEFKKVLKNNGYELDHLSGGHMIYKQKETGRTLVLGRNNYNKMIVQRLIKEYNLAI